MNNLDKAYYIIGLFPETQYYVGGISALKNGIALIKDIALLIIFRDSPAVINKYLEAVCNFEISQGDSLKQMIDLNKELASATGNLPNRKLINEAENINAMHNLWIISTFLLSGVDPIGHLDGLARGIITMTPVIGTAYSVYQIGRYWVVPKFL